MKTKQAVQVPVTEVEMLKETVKELLAQKLQDMIDCYANKKYHGKCALTHLSEMVKVFHQYKSIA